MISFRLSIEEYEKIRDICFSQGIRSVSEMARAGINLLLQQPSRSATESLETRVQELESRLNQLNLDVKKLSLSLVAASSVRPASDVSK